SRTPCRTRSERCAISTNERHWLARRMRGCARPPIERLAASIVEHQHGATGVAQRPHRPRPVELTASSPQSRYRDARTEANGLREPAMNLPTPDAQTPVARAARGEMPETRTDAAKPRGGDPVKELSDAAKRPAPSSRVPSLIVAVVI